MRWQQWGPQELYPGPEVSDDGLEAYVRATAVTYHHQVGTCKMGIDELAVVDPRSLKVHGLAGVRVADASVMPLVPTGNTNAAVSPDRREGCRFHHPDRERSQMKSTHQGAGGQK